jgi:hypothetical protein
LFVDCCSKFSPLIPLTHHTETWHRLSLAGLSGHPASEYRAVLAVLSFDYVPHGPTVEDCRIDITPGSVIELHDHLPDMELLILTIYPNLSVHVRDLPDQDESIIAFVQHRPHIDPPENIRIVCAWGILLLVFRRDEDEDTDVSIVHSEEGSAELRQDDEKHYSSDKDDEVDLE